MSGAKPDPAVLPDRPAHLGSLEEQVMDHLWDGGHYTVRQLIDLMGSDLAYTTVATVLTNLKKKGLACSQKDGYATLHFACLTRAEYAVALIEHALTASGNRTAAMEYFVQSMSESDLELVTRFLAERQDRN